MVLAAATVHLAHSIAAALAACAGWLLRLPGLLTDNLRRQWDGERCPRPHRADEFDPPDFPPPFY